MGVPDRVIKKEGRWKSEVYKVYVKANMDEHELVGVRRLGG